MHGRCDVAHNSTWPQMCALNMRNITIALRLAAAQRRRGNPRQADMNLTLHASSAAQDEANHLTMHISKQEYKQQQKC